MQPRICLPDYQLSMQMLKTLRFMEKLTLLELKNKLDRLTLTRLRRETEKIIRSSPSLVFRKQDEFRQGENPDGTTIGEYSRSPMGQEYRLFKLSLNPLAGGTVDLILTGSTIKNLQVVSLGSGEFYLYSTDPKWPSLVEKYGNQIIRINKEHFNGLQKHEYSHALISRMREIMR